MASSAEAGPSHAPGVSQYRPTDRLQLIQLQGAAPQWRQFSFFDLEDVKDAEDLASSPRSLKVIYLPLTKS
jgi:hypothetical protein